MARVLSGLIGLALLLAITATLLGTNVLDRAASQQERRHREELYQVELRTKQEIAALKVERERTLHPVKTVAVGMGVASAGMAALGLAWYVISELRKRSALIWPNDAGLYPLTQISLGNGVKVVHDPNRQPTGTTVYAREKDGSVSVIPIQLEGLEASVRQAQAVQLTRAAVSGHGLTESAQKTARRFFPQEGYVSSSSAPLQTLHSDLSDLRGYLEDSSERGDD